MKLRELDLYKIGLEGIEAIEKLPTIREFYTGNEMFSRLAEVKQAKNGLFYAVFYNSGSLPVVEGSKVKHIVKSDALGAILGLPVFDETDPFGYNYGSVK